MRTRCRQLAAISLALLCLPTGASTAPPTLDCGVLLTKGSPEFLEGPSGYIRILTDLATHYGRVFHRRGPKRFYLELADCLPDPEMREAAQARIEALGILEFDCDNADKQFAAASRIFSGFRALVLAWNQHRPDAAIPLENLHRKREALRALKAMGLTQALAGRPLRPDLDLFQNRESGSAIVLAQLASSAQLAFTRQPREVFEQLWRGLPDETDPELSAQAKTAIAAIRDSDGSNVFTQSSPAERCLKAWTALIDAYGYDIDPASGVETSDFLEAIDAWEMLEPPAVKFMGRSGGLRYFKAVVRQRKGTLQSEYAIRDFILETAKGFLSANAYEKFFERIGALPWQRKIGRAVGKRAGTSGRRIAQDRTKVRARGASGNGGNDGVRVFDALIFLAEAWNHQRASDPMSQIDLTQLHTPECIFKLFSQMNLSPPPVEKKPAKAATALVRRPRAVVSTSFDDEEVPESAPPPPPSPTNPLKVFMSASGGLAYLRGLVRQFQQTFESGYFLRNFFNDRARSLPSPAREAALEELGRLGWRSDDAVTAFVDEGVAARVLAALGIVAGRWNQAYAGDAPVTLNVSYLWSAEGVAEAATWWGMAGLTPEELAKRSGSGFQFRSRAAPAAADFPAVSTASIPLGPASDAKLPSGVVDAAAPLATMDPLSEEATILLRSLRSRFKGNAPRFTVATLLRVWTQVPKTDRTRPFRLALMDLIFVAAPRGIEEVRELIRTQLASSEFAFFEMATRGLLDYLEPGAPERHILNRRATESGDIGDFAQFILKQNP